MVEFINGYLDVAKPEDCYQVAESLNLGKLSFPDPYDEIRERFLGDILSQCATLPTDQPKSSVGICYSAMHGCGQDFVMEVLKRANFTKIASVAEQADPDEHFTTVRDPNPEVGYETLKLACETADKQDCRIILVNDPDADRLAMGENVNG